MTEYAVEVHNVSKLYRIGARQQTGPMRNMWLDMLQQPFKRTRSLLVNRLPTDADNILWALRDVSFNIEAGETFGIAGVNGSGKSTILKIICNVVHPTSGHTVTRGRIGMLLEVAAGFQMELTGRDNLYLKGAMLGMSNAEIKEREEAITAFAELEDFMDTPIKRYSTGMRVRLGFAIIANMDPDIVIVDEAFAVGDARFRERAVRELERFHAEGKTVLIVSHASAYLQRLCDRVIWLDKGREMMTGPTDEVIEAYNGATIDKLPARQAAQKQADTPTAGDQSKNPAPTNTGGSPSQFAPNGLYQAECDESRVACIREVRLLDANDQVTAQPDYASGFSIEVTYAIHKPFNGHLIAFIHAFPSRFRVLSIGDADQQAHLREERQPGTYRARLEIPGKVLNEGRYIATLSIDMPFVESFERATEALQFEVVNNDEEACKAWYQGNPRPGVIGYNAAWTYLGEEPVQASEPTRP